MRYFIRRTVAGVAVVVAGLVAGGCQSGNGSSSAANCTGRHAAAQPASGPAGSAGPAVAASWLLPGGQPGQHQGCGQPDQQLRCLEAGRGVVRAAPGVQPGL